MCSDILAFVHEKRVCANRLPVFDDQHVLKFKQLPDCFLNKFEKDLRHLPVLLYFLFSEYCSNQ